MSKVSIEAYSNCANILLAWKFDERIPDCIGFAILRKEKDARPDSAVPLMSSVGFEDEQNPMGGQKPSTERPFQRCLWNDWTAPRDIEVVYRVETVYKQGANHPVISSEWSNPVSLNVLSRAEKIEVFFNDGVIATQWVSKELQKQGQSGLIDAIKTEGNPIRTHLGGEILRNLTDRLDQAIKSNEHVYAALYEANDVQLENALIALGPRAHVVLANGSPQRDKETGEVTIDPNSQARELLRNHHVDVRDRIFETASGGITQHLGHNKFAVFCEDATTPKSVWTGSTNWTWSGLCTQMNNALFVEHEEVAKRFLDQWHLLANSGAEFPPGEQKLTKLPKPVQIRDATVTVSFTPYTGKKGTITSTQPADLAHAAELIEGAKQGILFLMFIPGPNGTLLETIQKMNAEQGATDLYVRGVVQQDPGPSAKVPSIALAHRGELLPVPFDIVYPEAVSTQMRWWIQEVKKLSHTNAIIHSKVVVVDPFGDHPVVITGSHNLGTKASLLNDENLVIVENHPNLAKQYAINICTVFNQYWWRFNRLPAPQKKMTQLGGADFHAKSEATPANLWKGLKRNDQWEDKYLPEGKQRYEVDFWMGEGVGKTKTVPISGHEAVKGGRKKAHKAA